VARKQVDKYYTKSEKQLLISLINDYSLFGTRDHEVIQILSKKIGKKYQKLFYWLKEESKAKIKILKHGLITKRYLEFHKKHQQ
jgi:hypothetical protein